MGTVDCDLQFGWSIAIGSEKVSLRSGEPATRLGLPIG